MNHGKIRLLTFTSAVIIAVLLVSYTPYNVYAIICRDATGRIVPCTPTPKPRPSKTPTRVKTASPTPTLIPTNTPTPVDTLSPTPTPVDTLSPTPVISYTPTEVGSGIGTITPTPIPPAGNTFPPDIKKWLIFGGILLLAGLATFLGGYFLGGNRGKLRRSASGGLDGFLKYEGMNEFPKSPGDLGEFPKVEGQLNEFPKSPGSLNEFPKGPGGLEEFPKTPGDLGEFPK